MRDNDSSQRSNRESKYWARVQAEMLSEMLKMREAAQEYAVLELDFRDGDDRAKWRERQSCQIGWDTTET